MYCSLPDLTYSDEIRIRAWRATFSFDLNSQHFHVPSTQELVSLFHSKKIAKSNTEVVCTLVMLVSKFDFQWAFFAHWFRIRCYLLSGGQHCYHLIWLRLHFSGLAFVRAGKIKEHFYYYPPKHTKFYTILTVQFRHSKNLAWRGDCIDKFI